MNIFGREPEQKELQKLYNSEEPAFLAVYGRRRIGKTHLIRYFFKDKGLFFHLTGIRHASREIQIQNFVNEFSDHFRKGKEVSKPSDWFDAFQMLRKEIEQLPKNMKKILFFDELPWLASPRSLFLQALDHLWNRYLSDIPNVILIVCGSAASWMIDHVINSRGGLHGRVTKEIRLLPFTLSETEQFLQAKGMRFDRKQIIELYMCIGGVAKYLTYLERGKSAAQMIGELCFSYNGPLVAEFHKLFRSLFDHHEDHVAIVRALAKKRSGLTYQNIMESTHLSTGGTLTKRIEELIQSGFVARMPLFDKGKQSHRYMLIDEYSLVHLTWNANVSAADVQGRGADYWLKQRNQPTWKTWTGHAFEALCLKHIDNIKSALGLSAVHTTTSKWRFIPSNHAQGVGAEIDLVIDRADHCINLCEVKFYDDVFTVDKSYAETLRRKRSCFEQQTNTRKSTFTTLITTYGAKHNQHYLASVDQELTMEALFEH